MNADAVAFSSPRAARNGNVDWAGRGLQKSPQLGRTAVTQHRFLSANENRCHPSTLSREVGMANRINTAVNAMKATVAHTPQDPVVAESCFKQLPNRHHAMLAATHYRDPPVWVGAFLGHMPSKSPRRRDSPLLELQVLQGGPAGVAGTLVFVVGGVGVVEGLAADGAEAGALGAAEEAGGEGEQGRVVGPAADVQLVVDHVGAAQLLVVGRGLVDLAPFDLEVQFAWLEAAHAGPLQVYGEAEAEGVAAAGPRDLEPDRGGD